MIKFLKTIRDDVRGTALLVALLVMGVLLAISLALSSLIFRETRIVMGVVDAGKAYYAAESAIEEALYELDSNLPGWQQEKGLGEVSDDAVYKYVVKNQCKSYPCFDEEEYDLSSVSPDKLYDVLDLNENIIIPLFTLGEDGKVEAVEDFTVQFYTNFNPKTDLKINNVSGWDVLRWKVFGMREIKGNYLTESLHDFTAVSERQGSGDLAATNAEKPSWFGTKGCGQDGRIKCLPYAGAEASSSEESNWQVCTQTQARDYYLYDDEGSQFQSKISCYPIKDFMNRSQPNGASGGTGLNYLSLTNLMNPSMLNEKKFNNEQRLIASKIFFRVETYDKETVREFADITADGFSGRAKQSISVQIRKDSYMPVFNFSLYSTYKDGVENYDAE